MIERELDKLENRWDASFSDLRSQLAILRQDVAVFHANFEAQEERTIQLEGSVNEDVKGLRKVLIAAGVSILIAAVTFAITSLAVFGGPG